MTDPLSDVLHFWFEECQPSHWFTKDADFDASVERRFGALVASALAGELTAFEATEDGCMGLILVLDQFTRNIFRDTPRAFAGDRRAIDLTRLCVERGYLANPSAARRQFMLMPLMHSEDLAVHDEARPLFERYTDPRVQDFAIRHRDIVARFGRYPHRNQILGRVSTPEELHFLTQPGSSF